MNTINWEIKKLTLWLFLTDEIFKNLTAKIFIFNTASKEVIIMHVLWFPDFCSFYNQSTSFLWFQPGTKIMTIFFTFHQNSFYQFDTLPIIFQQLPIKHFIYSHFLRTSINFFFNPSNNQYLTQTSIFARPSFLALKLFFSTTHSFWFQHLFCAFCSLFA